MDSTVLRAQSDARRAAVPARARELVDALLCAARFAHPVGTVEMIETHISFVLLAGDDAYKIKKPVDLGFVDFATLESRRICCEEEVRLNRRTAPGLYLGVVPIAGPAEAPVVGGSGPALEYAVHMRRFAQDALLDRVARAGRLARAHVDSLARAVVALHGQAERAGAASPYATPQRVLGEALANFHAIEALEPAETLQRSLEALREWTAREHRAIAPLLAERRSDGYVRECHGDLHLANVVLLDDVSVPFDALEFDPALRWIDVMSEVAFTVMDLERHRLPALAARFLDRYLQDTGDFAGLRVLRFYTVYRAMVRAKVACIRAHQLEPGDPARAAAHAELAAHVALAQRIAHAPRPALVLMHGLSGSGKTDVSERLVEALGAVRLRSDVERKRRHGLPARARSASAPGAGLYAHAETDLTYGRLAELGAWALAGRYCVVVDATFLKRAQRDAFRALASATGASFAIAACQAPERVLRVRIERRARDDGDASEASLAVLAMQLAGQEPLGRDEVDHAVFIDTTDSNAVDAACASLAGRLRHSLARR